MSFLAPASDRDELYAHANDQAHADCYLQGNPGLESELFDKACGLMTCTIQYSGFIEARPHILYLHEVYNINRPRLLAPLKFATLSVEGARHMMNIEDDVSARRLLQTAKHVCQAYSSYPNVFYSISIHASYPFLHQSFRPSRTFRSTSPS